MRALRERPPKPPKETLVLARHGATDPNEANQRDPQNAPVQGRSMHEPISPQGVRDSIALGFVLVRFLSSTGRGAGLEFTRVQTSGATRGRQTVGIASLVLQANDITIPAPTHDPRLLEISKGDAERVPLGIVKTWYTPEQLRLRAKHQEGWDFRHGSAADPGESAREAALRQYEWFDEAAANADSVPQPLDSGKRPARLVIVHNLVSSHAIAWAMRDAAEDEPPFFPNARSHMVPNGVAHIAEVYDSGIFFDPALLSAAGPLACEGCVAYQR